MCTTRHKRDMNENIKNMYNEIKGNIFALNFMISHPGITQDTIHRLLLFILFLYWVSVGYVTVAIMMYTEVVTAEVSSATACPALEDLPNSSSGGATASEAEA